MLRSRPLRRKPPKQPSHERSEHPVAPGVLRPLRPGTYAGGLSGASVEKEAPIVCEEYRVLVRLMPCMHCGHPPLSQFCHGDMGKGMGMKTDDRTGWPGCGPHNHRPGCHWLIGTSGTFPKQVRRDLEAEYARRTRAEIVKRGLWPADLPMLEE
jgi:hypothetical protein